MVDTPIGMPIPVGSVEPHVNDNPMPISPPADAMTDPALEIYPFPVATRATDDLLLAPMKIALATLLAGWAFALNPLFAFSASKPTETDVA